MRKRESLYLHALCVLLREAVERRRDPPADAFESYDHLDVQPTAVHRTKSAHERAVFALLDDLTAAVETGDAAALPVDADGGRDQQD